MKVSMSDHIPPDVLQRVVEAQAAIDAAVSLIGAELDAVLLRDGQFDHLSVVELESSINALPENCFYKVDLKRAWRRAVATEQPARQTP